tara:strand:- start:8254 stop:9408 length:1155 start_codon:yes stop_codon:yes gene_type:complete
MIPRYKVKEVHDIWATDNKLNTWLKVELAHLDALASSITHRTITEEELITIKSNVKIDKQRWQEIEAVTRHDVQAFVQMLEESIPDNSGRWIHYGLTSSDILDTSLVLMCQESLQVIVEYISSTCYHLNKLMKLESSSFEILARTHGKAAEVQSYYDIYRRWIRGLRRGLDALVETKKKMNFGKMSGPVGNYTTNSPGIESNALRLLGLYPTLCSQIIPRDMFLDYFYAILKVMLAVEKIAYDIRIYSMDGINEMSEPFRKGQKGSSAMPHKKNPILTENICGLSRLYKSYMNTAIENCQTLLERDISHSCTERIIFKDAAHIACYTLSKLTYIFKDMNINTDFAQKNVDDFRNKVSSQNNMNELISQGISRTEAHNIAQQEDS